MFLDTPATIAILGAGPIGIETALYARFLGYDVTIFERGDVCERLRGWQDLPLLSTFGNHASSLGLAALAAHDQHYQSPTEDTRLTVAEWISAYLAPLSKTDLIVDHLRLRTEVLSVARVDSEMLAPAETLQLEADEIDEDAADDVGGLDTIEPAGQSVGYAVTFRAPHDGKPQTERFDAVIDATGAELQLAGSNRGASGQNVDPRQIRAIALDAHGHLAVRFSVEASELQKVEQLIDYEFESQLAIKRSPESAAILPMEAWLGQSADSILSYFEAATIDGLLTGEPNFFVIGSKSFGCQTTCRYPLGLQQIRIVFSDLGGRADLNLYRNFA